jgi:hypothetical protein
VDWYPWGDEALARARNEDRPIFLSIGYSACHWCHVMERESFENDAIAAFMNDHFVNVKVDREERPDLDEIYMTAVMAMTGRGGWPMSVFLTPDLEPFYGGTYYPPVDAGGQPGFLTVLRGLAAAWKDRRTEALQTAAGLTKYLRESASPASAGPGPLGPDLIPNAARMLRASFDAEHGGWGGAPKFPSSGAIALLLREHRRSSDAQLLRMVRLTLDRMARGGIYDQLGGGFHRYAVDEQWLVPHFEKMLYDNAQLAQVYLEAFQATGKSLYRRVAQDTLDYVLRDMQAPEGGFYASEDADSEGREGQFYLWTRREIDSVLGSDAEFFCTYYGVKETGNFPSHESYHAGQNILFVPKPPGTTGAVVEERLANARNRLVDVRKQRVRPGLDDKLLTSWNALMITALARGAQVLGEPRYREAAERAARRILGDRTREGRLLHMDNAGEDRVPGFLDDYALMANALVDLYEATFDAVWIAEAERLAREMMEQFGDPSGAGFFFAGPHHQHLLLRTKPLIDGQEPSGNSAAALALLRLANYTGDETFADHGRQVLESSAEALAQLPQAHLKMLIALDYFLEPACEVVLAGERGSPGMDALLGALHGVFLPNKAVALADASSGAEPSTRPIPFTEGKTMLEERATAYVCRNHTCGPPVFTPEALGEQLADENQARWAK